MLNFESNRISIDFLSYCDPRTTEVTGQGSRYEEIGTSITDGFTAEATQPVPIEQGEHRDH